mgnify:CR=1 FL=1
MRLGDRLGGHIVAGHVVGSSLFNLLAILGGMAALYALFQKAPELGSLIDPMAATRGDHALLWDRKQDREAQADFNEARVPQAPYVYQTHG